VLARQCELQKDTVLMPEQTEPQSTAGEEIQESLPDDSTAAQRTAGLNQTESLAEDQAQDDADAPPVVPAAPDGTEDQMPRPEDDTRGWYMADPEIETPTREIRGSATSGVLTRVSLGGALLAVDAINERLEQVEQPEEEDEASPRTLDVVLVPEAEWDERFGQAPGMAARHLALGVAIDTRSKVSRSLDILNGFGNVTVRALEFVFDPITHSRPFRPVRKRFHAAVDRGENQVNVWMNLGRTEDVRSRQMAETALTHVVDESMDELVDNERVQEFVQEMLAAQSLGIIDEAIEEIRERAVSSDTFFEYPFRRIFRRSSRRSIPGPAFDRRLIRPASKRSAPIDDSSLLGYYAGFTSRFLALAIDVALIVILMAMTGWIFQTIGRLIGESPRLESLALTEEMLTAVSVIISSLNAAAIIFAYAFIFWLMTGQTPGMMMLGLRVVSTDGGHLTFWRAVLRLFGYVISAAFLFLGFAWVLVDDRRQGWHDKLGKTIVVYSWDAHPDETFLTYQMRIGD
jgi:uncharacterized RDD family membrane protein YckC